MLSSVHVAVRPYWNIAEVTITSVHSQDHDSANEQETVRFTAHDDMAEYNLQDPVGVLELVIETFRRWEAQQ